MLTKKAKRLYYSHQLIGGKTMDLKNAVYNGTSEFPAGIFDRLLEPICKIIPVWITPNMITVFRVLPMTPFVFVLFLLGAVLNSNVLIWLGVVALLFTLLLDALDGALARYRRNCTALGKVSDPLADKAQILTLLSQFSLAVVIIALVVADSIPVEWWYWVVLATDFFGFAYLEVKLTKIRLADFAYEVVQNHPDTRALASTLSGKIKMILQSAGIMLMMCSINEPTSVIGTVGVFTFLASIPLSWKSYAEKKAKHQTTEKHHTPILPIAADLIRRLISDITPRFKSRGNK